MKIKDSINVLQTQKILGLTPKGRGLTDNAISYIDASLQDIDNYNQDVIECLNCGFIWSSLLSADGCPNCGNLDLTKDIGNKKIEKE